MRVLCPPKELKEHCSILNQLIGKCTYMTDYVSLTVHIFHEPDELGYTGFLRLSAHGSNGTGYINVPAMVEQPPESKEVYSVSLSVLTSIINKTIEAKDRNIVFSVSDNEKTGRVLKVYEEDKEKQGSAIYKLSIIPDYVVPTIRKHTEDLIQISVQSPLIYKMYNKFVHVLPSPTTYKSDLYCIWTNFSDEIVEVFATDGVSIAMLQEPNYVVNRGPEDVLFSFNPKTIESVYRALRALDSPLITTTLFYDTKHNTVVFSIAGIAKLDAPLMSTVPPDYKRFLQANSAEAYPHSVLLNRSEFDSFLKTVGAASVSSKEDEVQIVVERSSGETVDATIDITVQGPYAVGNGSLTVEVLSEHKEPFKNLFRTKVDRIKKALSSMKSDVECSFSFSTTPDRSMLIESVDNSDSKYYCWIAHIKR